MRRKDKPESSSAANLLRTTAILANFPSPLLSRRRIDMSNRTSFGAGALIAYLLCGLVAANSPQQAPTGRFEIKMEGEFALMVDTVNGRAWNFRFKDGDQGFATTEFMGAKTLAEK
jgi:hypothetical protein